jgi:ubiquinone/menaquinone biosynthesis C-methylase UbiE
MPDIGDEKTARAFSTSWNTLPKGSVYTQAQFEEWMLPLVKSDVRGKRVVELGCGNASLLVHMASWEPAYLEGVDLGDSILSARKNMAEFPTDRWNIKQADLTQYESAGYDVVYCIGVLHHLKEPKKGFDSVIRNTKPGGRFHCWVYAREGNALVRYVVDPLRKVASRLPWWFTKYFVATPCAVPFYVYAKLLSIGKNLALLRKLPLFDYCQWIAKREFWFFRHVAFDQLVTPQTAYIPRSMIEEWLATAPSVDRASTYSIFRNGNSWKFGGKKLA